MRSPEGFVTVAHGAGAIQGDSVFGEMFSNTYEPQISDWVTETVDERLMVTGPFTGVRVDASLNGFVDDFFRVAIQDGCRASHVALTVSRKDTSLDRHLSKINVAQHPGKLKYCGVLGGQDSRTLQRELARGHVLQGTFFKSVKHLGFLASGNGSMTDERNARCAAVESTWFSFQKIGMLLAPSGLKS